MTARRSALAAGLAVGVLAFPSAAVVRPLSGQGATAVASLDLIETWSSDEVAGLELAWVGGVVETPAGMIWISDPSTPVVISVDPSGGGPTVIARGGDGPGEVQSPDRIALTPEATWRCSIWSAAWRSSRPQGTI